MATIEILSGEFGKVRNSNGDVVARAYKLASGSWRLMLPGAVTISEDATAEQATAWLAAQALVC